VLERLVDGDAFVRIEDEHPPEEVQGPRMRPREKV
jgi:hypothetical protein